MAVLLSLVSAVCLGVYLIYEKKAVKTQEPAQFVFSRTLLTFVVTFPLIFFVPRPNLFVLGILILKSVVSALQYYLVASANQRVPISYLSPSKAITPLFALMFSLLLFREPATFLDLYGIVLLIIGMFLLQANYDWWKDKVLLIPFLVFIILPRFLSSSMSAINFSAVESIKQMSTDYSEAMLVFGILIWDKILLLPSTMMTVLFSGKSIKIRDLKINSWTVRSAATHLLSEITYFFALLSGYLIVIVVRRLDVLVSTVLGGKLFNEKNLARNISATFVMISGAVLVLI